MSHPPSTEETLDLAAFAALEPALLEACLATYGERLVSLLVFGSVGRGTPRPDSDIDLLVVAEALPDGRMARVSEFTAVEASLAPALALAEARGVHTRLSPVFKTPTEADRGSPLFLDMVDDGRLLCDRGGFMATVLDQLRARMAELGSRRVWRGSAWYWDLKPDFQPGEVFRL